jgi:predicted helicase
MYRPTLFTQTSSRGSLVGWSGPIDQLGSAETGIGLVGIKRDGGVCAIQCKFIPAGQSVSKPAIDSFLSASSREPFTSSQLRPSAGGFVDWSSRRPSLVRWSRFDFIGGSGFGMAISKFDLSQL